MNALEQNETEIAEIDLDASVPYYNDQRADMIYRILQKKNCYRVLDVGCGVGKVTTYLSLKGLDMVGIDISSRLINLSKKKAKSKKAKCEFILVELDKYIPKKKFDAVLFAGVLEHIEDEVELMSQAKKILKKGGKIIITDMPAFSILYTPRDKRIGHVRRYNVNLARKNLISAGYSEEKIFYYNFLMLFGSLYLIFFKKSEYPYFKEGKSNIIFNTFLHFWYTYLENKFIFPIGDRLTSIGTYNPPD
jgi:ubiquinone/menaquinone biosynthesis C-methylase UbiE